MSVAVSLNWKFTFNLAAKSPLYGNPSSFWVVLLNEYQHLLGKLLDAGVTAKDKERVSPSSVS